MAETKMQLVDWLDDLCVRFIINLPVEELASPERLCFQIEEAQWFYEDFIRPTDPALPSLSLRTFSMRMFQHCPMLSQWSPYHQEAAFEEFLRYKTRVPVRGAIMLNHAMDHVLLVKGWKKAANWSFPRGKINKDENDLDCAIREVYEETGYDIRAAGLVKEDDGNKYIDIIMREQQMRLYVFRDVPMDTHFAPKTRKEISRIEWYRLSDLPTMKRQKHHDVNGQDLAVYAHKFYMVAPFLGPLKKWINQQRKQDLLLNQQMQLQSPEASSDLVTGRISQAEAIENLLGAQLSQLAKANLMRGPLTEDETANDPEPTPAHDPFPTNENNVSDLPEVSITRSTEKQDASFQLKHLLNIAKPSQVSQTEKSPSNMDPEKADALLALLRENQKATESLLTPTREVPATPFEQLTTQPNMPPTPRHHHPQSRPFSQLPPPPPPPPFYAPHPSSKMNASTMQQHQAQPQPYPWNVQPGQPQQYAQNSTQRGAPNQFVTYGPQIQPSFPPENFSLPNHQVPFSRLSEASFPPSSHNPRSQRHSATPQHPSLPQFPNLHMPSIPTNSRLPPKAHHLTPRSLNLLKAFKSNDHTSSYPAAQLNQSGMPNRHASEPNSAGSQTFAPLIPHSQLPPQVPVEPGRPSGDMYSHSSGQPAPKLPAMSVESSPKSTAADAGKETSVDAAATKARPRSQHQENLLSLFKKPAITTAEAPSTTTPTAAAAAPPAELSANPSPFPSHHAASVKIAKRPSPRAAKIDTHAPKSSKGELTSATVSGPLNQPQFEGIAKSASRNPSISSEVREKATKTQITPKTILARPAVEKVASPEELRPFKPQILRRNVDIVTQPPRLISKGDLPQLSKIQPRATIKQHQQTPTTKAPDFDRRGSQTEPHKQNLLALFGKSTAAGRSPVSASNSPPVAASPASLISPLGDTRVGATPPMRSRIGSLSSLGGTGAAAPTVAATGAGVGAQTKSPTSVTTSTQATSKEDREFLLKYLDAFAKSEK